MRKRCVSFYFLKQSTLSIPREKSEESISDRSLLRYSYSMHRDECVSRYHLKNLKRNVIAAVKRENFSFDSYACDGIAIEKFDRLFVACFTMGSGMGEEVAVRSSVEGW